MAFRCSKPQHYSWPKNVLDSLILKNITLMSELFQFISYHFKMFLRVISHTGFVACEQLEPRNNKKCQISVSWEPALCRSSADLLPHPEMYTSSPDMALLTVSCVLCPSPCLYAAQFSSRVCIRLCLSTCACFMDALFYCVLSAGYYMKIFGVEAMRGSRWWAQTGLGKVSDN